MGKDIKLFLPLYTGTYVRVTTKEAKFDAVLAGVLFDRWHSSLRPHELTIQVAFGDDFYHYYKLDHVQLLLRPASDMTYDELREFLNQPHLTDEYCQDKIYKIGGSVFGLHNAIAQYGSHNSLVWLLSKGFDLFGLIEAGLAIDKTKEVRNG